MLSMARMMKRQDRRKEPVATAPKGACRTTTAVPESRKSPFATTADATADSTPAASPPNQVAAATAGKKKMNGKAEGPTNADNASLASHPTTTAPAAKP